MNFSESRFSCLGKSLLLCHIQIYKVLPQHHHTTSHLLESFSKRVSKGLYFVDNYLIQQKFRKATQYYTWESITQCITTKNCNLYLTDHWFYFINFFIKAVIFSLLVCIRLFLKLSRWVATEKKTVGIPTRTHAVL